MAITKQQKVETVEKLSRDLEKLKLAVLTDYRGLSTKELEELRDNLRENGISYRVTKNTLVRLAAAGQPKFADADFSIFNGPMAIAVSFDDEVAPARLIFQYAKQHDALEIVGALTGDGQLLNAAETKALALLPTKEQLLGQLVGTVAAPLSGMVGVLSGNLRNLINVMSAVAAK